MLAVSGRGHPCLPEAGQRTRTISTRWPANARGHQHPWPLARILRKDRRHRVLDLLFGLFARRTHQILVHRGVPQRLLGLAVVDVYADDTFLVDIGVIPAPPAAVPAVAP